MKKSKSEIITFKVDAALSEVLHGISNRSEFIRAAVTAALGAVCPLCQGTGILTPHQKEHWESFSRDHSIQKCRDCEELYLNCSRPTRLTQAG
jgi:hypothetical protein